MRERNQAVSARLFIGVMFLLCGVLWTLDNLNIVESEPILDWWPLALVIFGLFHFAGAFGPRRGLAGTVWTTLGVLMVAHNFGYFPLSLFELWPVVLIGIGASIVWRSYRGPQAGQSGKSSGVHVSVLVEPGAQVSGDVGDETFSAVAMWSGVARRSTSQNFRGGDATAIMGGVEIDLRGAKSAPGGAVLDVYAVMGGIEIYVPSNWKVINEAVAVMGGVEDNRPAGVTGENVLILKGAAIMGGIELKGGKKKSDSDE